MAMIAVGVVGSNYGRTVLIPAFRHDPRCEVIALAGADAARTTGLARDVKVARAFGGWRELVGDRNVEAVAIAVPPDLQPPVAQPALEPRKPRLLQKPLPADLPRAPLIPHS